MNFQKFKLNLEMQRNQNSNYQHLLDHWKSKRGPENHILLPYWLCQSLWLCITINCGKFWKRWEYQNSWPASWEICVQVKKATVRNGHRTTHRFQVGKGVCQGCIFWPCLFMQSSSWEMLDWMKCKLKSILPREISITSDMKMTSPLWQKVKKN